MTASPDALEQSEERDLLQQCPCCGYSLRGLPIEHRCPECGFELDRRWQVFGGKSIPRKSRLAGRPMVILLVVLGVLVAGCVGIQFFLGRSTSGMISQTALVVPVLLAVAAAFAKPNRFIVLGPTGVLIYKNRRQTAAYSWPDIGRAHFHTGRGAIALPVADETVYLPSFLYFGSLVFEADRCVRAINRYPRETPSEHVQ